MLYTEVSVDASSTDPVFVSLTLFGLALVPVVRRSVAPNPGRAFEPHDGRVEARTSHCSDDDSDGDSDDETAQPLLYQQNRDGHTVAARRAMLRNRYDQCRCCRSGNDFTRHKFSFGQSELS